MKNVFFPMSLIFGIISVEAHATKWAYCDANQGTPQGLAYADAQLTQPKPVANGICQLPAASATGDAQYANTQRCLNGQDLNCDAASLAAAGLTPSPLGENDVPQGAWYAAAGATTTYPTIRCSCGCFTPDTNLLTTKGWQRIDKLKEQSKTASDHLLIPSAEKGLAFKHSETLRPFFFTKGAEEKPVIRVQLENGFAVEMTELHPVPVKHGKETTMVQAKTLTIGDELIRTDGKALKVVRITTRKLQPENNYVYNVNTYGHGSDEHILVANGIRLGDLSWQNKLAEREQRENNILGYK